MRSSGNDTREVQEGTHEKFQEITHEKFRVSAREGQGTHEKFRAHSKSSGNHTREVQGTALTCKICAPSLSLASSSLSLSLSLSLSSSLRALITCALRHVRTHLCVVAAPYARSVLDSPQYYTLGHTILEVSTGHCVAPYAKRRLIAAYAMSVPDIA
eukprot:2774900-Rhodomonas_salina.1